MILDEPDELKPEHFPAHILDGRDPRTAGAATHGPDAGLVPLAEVEQRQILYTLERTGNNKSQAARILGISRQTLREKLKQYGERDEELTDEAES